MTDYLKEIVDATIEDGWLYVDVEKADTYIKDGRIEVDFTTACPDNLGFYAGRATAETVAFYRMLAQTPEVPKERKAEEVVPEKTKEDKPVGTITEFRVHSNIPVPPQTRKDGSFSAKYPFKDMKVGDSFVLAEYTPVRLKSAQSQVSSRGRRLGCKFIARKAEGTPWGREGDIVIAVWRTA